jgi:hypothetical protein
MSIFDDILVNDAQFFGHPDMVPAEPVTLKTPDGATTWNLNLVIDRPEPESQGGGVFRPITAFIPRDPTGEDSPATMDLEYQLTVPWWIGQTPTLFRVKRILQQDAGGWHVQAEQSAN